MFSFLNIRIKRLLLSGICSALHIPIHSFIHSTITYSLPTKGNNVEIQSEKTQWTSHCIAQSLIRKAHIIYICILDYVCVHMYICNSSNSENHQSNVLGLITWQYPGSLASSWPLLIRHPCVSPSPARKPKNVALGLKTPIYDAKDPLMSYRQYHCFISQEPYFYWETKIVSNICWLFSWLWM